MKGGASVAVVTDAGTPGISDPAYRLIREAVRGGFTVIPVPGASALLAALVASGFPADRFVFEGFLPLKKGRRTRWERLKEEERTIVVYESPQRIVRALEELVEILGDRRVAVARELTKKFEEVLRGRASEVLKHLREKLPRGEIVLVIAGTGYREP
jgi:16S rRNA (cytidine1402-2'-O)-methyltransferase